MNYEFLNVYAQEGVAWIRFNRPGQLNAMNRAMMEEILSALAWASDAPPTEISALVLTGEGKAFMAGADIKEYATQTREAFEAFQTRGQEIYRRIEGSPKPVVAAVNGYAFGGGFEIALSCDLILAKEGAKFGLPEISLKLIPGGGGTQRLCRKAGSNFANELLMTGRSVTAEQLERRGLVNQVYESSHFDEHVSSFARALASQPLDRLTAIKHLTGVASGRVDPAALELERKYLSQFYLSPEGQQAVHSFYKKSLERNP